LGLPQSLLSAHSLESQGIWSAWGSDEVFEKSFVFSPYGHGWHVDRCKFDASLADAARDLGAEFVCGTQLISCEPDGEARWRLSFTGPNGDETCEASFLIDASGRSLSLGRKLGARRVVFDKLIGIAQLFSTNASTAPPEPVTLVEAAEDGWWYSAPLPGSSLIVVYLTDADLHRRSFEEPVAGWARMLEATCHTQRRTDGLVRRGRLRTIMADTYRVRFSTDSAGWLNAGAAAIGLDPLSSDGICFALRSGRDAARAAAAHLDGTIAAIPNYSHSLDQYFERYMAERSNYYNAEIRWPRSLFWSRRRSKADTQEI